ncbi:MAG TPA: tetratricopeptide repeat protein, partial [Blastocatellia bacterium]|nr:tetratricopeptide repeat protein [Blastocatellia bacterium]
NNVGTAFGRLGDYKRCIEYTSSAWEILKELLGENHPNVLFIKLTIATAHVRMGDNISASRIVEALMRDVPKELPLRSDVEELRKMILTELIQKEGCQPPVNPGKRKKGKKKR